MLLNTAVAKAGDPVKMAEAFARAVEAGRLALRQASSSPATWLRCRRRLPRTPFFKIDRVS